MSKLYMKNSDGKPSASLTMALLSFVIVTAWLVFWVVGTAFGLHNIPAFESTVAMGYMTPLLGLYFGRRWNEGKVTDASQSSDEAVDESLPEEEEEETTEQQEEETVEEEQAPVTVAPATTTTNKRGKRS